MVSHNDEIGVLPQERERNKNAREDESFPTEKNETSKRDLKKQIKKQKFTTEQLQQHINTDPKLKAVWQESQVILERQKKATERVKNTGYLGTLWGGITGDSGVDDLAKINEDSTAVHRRFLDALDKNSQLDAGLRKQLIGFKLGAASDVNTAASEASGGFSDRANDYKNATIATAVGAGALATGGFLGGVALAGGATYAAGGGTMLTLGGAAAGGALAGEIGARGYSLARDGVGVMMGGKGPSANEYIERSNQTGAQGRVFGAALPLAAVPAGQAALAVVGSYAGAKSIQNSAENFLQADQLSRIESGARKSGDTQYADTLKGQKDTYLREGFLSAGYAAAVAGVGRMANSALKKVGGAKNSETGTSPTSKGSPISPETPQSTPTNPRELHWRPKNGGENIHKNPNKPVDGVTLPEPGKGFYKARGEKIQTEKWRDAGGNTRETTKHYGRNEADVTWTDMSKIKPDGTKSSFSVFTPGRERQFFPNRGVSDWVDQRVSSTYTKKSPNGTPIIETSKQHNLSSSDLWERRMNAQMGQINKENGNISSVPDSKHVAGSDAYPTNSHLSGSSDSPPIARNPTIRQRTYDDGGRIVSGSNISRNTDGFLKSSVTKKPDGSLQGVRSLKNEGGSVLKNIDAQGATTLRKKWTEGSNGEISVNTKYPQTGREKVDSINAVLPGQETGGRLGKPVSDVRKTTEKPQLPDHLNTAAKPEPVKTNEKTPQNPSTPPEKLKDITLDPEELIRKRSLKK